MTDEEHLALAAAVAEAEAAEDVLELTASLLRYCRSELAWLNAHSAAPEVRDRIAAVADGADGWIGEHAPLVTRSTAARVGSALRGAAEPAVTARGLALALDLRCREYFGGLQADEDPFELIEGTPFVTPVPDLDAAFSGRRFTTSRANKPGAVRADEVAGLSLASDARLDGFRVVIETRAGSMLEEALCERPAFDLAAASPNVAAREFAPVDVSGPGFFGVRLSDGEAQVRTVADLLSRAEDAAVSIVVFPELCRDEANSEQVLQRVAAGPSPPVVLAGSAHLTVGGRPVNRATVVYPLRNGRFEQDKVAPVILRGPDGPCEERLQCGRTVLVHAGPTRTMVTMTCADMLAPGMADLVNFLAPSIVLVAAMTPKISGFEREAERLVGTSQAFVVVANYAVEHETSTPAALFGRPFEPTPIRLAVSPGRPAVAVLRGSSDEVEWSW